MPKPNEGWRGNPELGYEEGLFNGVEVTCNPALSNWLSMCECNAYLSCGDSILEHNSIDGAVRLSRLDHLLYSRDAWQFYHWRQNILRTNQRPWLRRMTYLLQQQ